MVWMQMQRLLDKTGLVAKPQIVVDQDPIDAEQASADPDWVLAKFYIRERLIVLRRRLELLGTPIEETEGIRLAIIELEGVLNFRKPSKMTENASE